MFDSDAKNLANFVARMKRTGVVAYTLRCNVVQHKSRGAAPAWRTIQSWDVDDKRHEPIATWVKNLAESDAANCTATTVYTLLALDKDGNPVGQVTDRAEPVEADAPETSPDAAALTKCMEMLAAAQAHTGAVNDQLLEMSRVVTGNNAALMETVRTLSAENRDLWKISAENYSDAAIAKAGGGGIDAQGWLDLLKEGFSDWKTYKMLQLEQERQKLEIEKTNVGASS